MVVGVINSWDFFSEGETCFIFSCASKPLILRVNKLYSNQEIPRCNGILKDKHTIDQQKVDDFYNNVVKKLVPSKYLLDVDKKIEIDENLAKKLNDVLNRHRHQLRQKESTIQVGSIATIMRDMTRYNQYMCSTNSLKNISSVMIEIKPKFGIVHNRQVISPRYCPYKCILCRFCMYKHVKEARGQHDYAMKILDGYCPQKLFSCHRSHVHEAIGSLIDSSPKNLKIFFDGKLIDTKTSENLFVRSQLHNLLSNVLYIDSNQLYAENNTFQDSPIEKLNKIYNHSHKCIEYEDNLCDYRPPEDYVLSPIHRCRRNNDFILKKRYCHPNFMGPYGILGIVHKIQSTDLYGIERLFRAYDNLLDCDSFDILDDYKSSEWKETINDLLSGKKYTKISNTCVRNMILLLLSMAFRDCSILINLSICNGCQNKNTIDQMALQKLIHLDSSLDFSNFNNSKLSDVPIAVVLEYLKQQCNSSNIHLHYDIKLIDFDPKTHKNIPYYHYLDKKIVRDYEYLKTPYRKNVPVNIRFFGPLNDIYHNPHLQMMVPRTITVNLLLNLVADKQPGMRSAMGAYSLSLNYEYLTIDRDVQFDVVPGDEIGIMENMGGG